MFSGTAEVSHSHIFFDNMRQQFQIYEIIDTQIELLLEMCMGLSRKIAII